MVSEREALEQSGWTDLELSIYDAVALGQEGGPDTKSNARTEARWADSLAVDAERIAQMLLNPPRETDPRRPLRIRIRNVRIRGILDLGCGSTAPFLFMNCQFDEKPMLNDTRASFVGFLGCKLPGLDATRLRCEGPVWLDDVHAVGPVDLEDAEIFDLSASNLTVDPVRQEAAYHHALCLCNTRVAHDVNLSRLRVIGALGLNRARVGNSLVLSGAKLRKEGLGDPGLHGQAVEVGGALRLDRGFESDGTVDFSGARVGGPVSLEGASVHSQSSGDALRLNHGTFDGGIGAEEMRLNGSLNLTAARVAAHLFLSKTKIAGGKPTAVRAEHLKVQGTLFFDGAEVDAPIDFHGAVIGCHLRVQRLVVSTSKPDGYGLAVDHAEVAGDIAANGSTLPGGMSLVASKIGGGVFLRKTRISAEKGGICLIFNRATVQGTVDASLSSLEGRVSATYAVVNGSLDLTDVELGDGSPDRAAAFSNLRVSGDLLLTRTLARGAMDLDRCQISGDVRLTDAKLEGAPAQTMSRGSGSQRATGKRWRGTALALVGAEIGGDLDCSGMRFDESIRLSGARITRAIDLENATPPAKPVPVLVGDELQAGALNMKFAKEPLGDVDLRHASIKSIVDVGMAWPKEASVQIEGLEYSRLAAWESPRERLQWLARATPKFSPQPYEQLASHYTLLGQEDFARRVRLEAARRSHQAGGPARKISGMIQDAVLGYGYLASRAAIWVAIFLALGTVYFSKFAGTCAYEGSVQDGLCPTSSSHPTWSPFLYTLDLLLPILSFGYDSAWRTTGLTQVVAVSLTVFGWVLITTVIAAFSRILRRS